MKRLVRVDKDLNVFTVSYESHLLDKLRKVFDASLRDELLNEQNSHLFSGGKNINYEIYDKKLKFHVQSFGMAPLLWISNNNIRTYNLFKAFLQALDIIDDIKELVDYKKQLRMYCGFFVIGNKMDIETWHIDYHEGANAYTLITPLFELDASHGNLLYKDKKLNIKKYSYKMNEAVVFGDNFFHATEPYIKTNNLRIMVSVTVGTDKPEYWNILKKTIGDQSNFMMLPCGHQKGTCHCLERFI